MKIIDFHSLLDTNSSDDINTALPLHGHELQELVNPLSSEEFVNSYFSQTSLNVEGHPKKFEHIFSWEKLRRALAKGQTIRDRRYNIMASFTSGEEFGSSRRMMEAQHNQVSELLNAGATICITNIHMADPSLARWAQAIRTQLNFTGTVGINCYISPDGSGLPMHYDKRVATTLQIEGKKIWKFSTKPAKAWPDQNTVYQHGQMETDVGKLPADMEFREVELQPGDLLCLPAGAWHSARGIGHSLALNLYFAPRNLLDQFIPLLQEFAASNEHWRGGPPATAEKIQGDKPKQVSAYMRERLDEFYKMAKEIIEGPESLTESWLNSLTHHPYTGWKPDAMLDVPEVTINQRFCIATSPLRFIETKDNVIIPCDNGVLKFSAILAPILHRLSESESFTIPELLAWQPSTTPQSETMTYLKALYANGIIKMI